MQPALPAVIATYLVMSLRFRWCKSKGGNVGISFHLMSEHCTEYFLQPPNVELLIEYMWYSFYLPVGACKSLLFETVTLSCCLFSCMYVRAISWSFSLHNMFGSSWCARKLKVYKVLKACSCFVIMLTVLPYIHTFIQSFSRKVWYLW